MIRFLFAVFFAISLLCVVGGLGLAVAEGIFVARASKATGQVVGHLPMGDLPMPIFVFTNASGQSHTVTQTTASVFHPMPVGSAVEVLYLARDPSKAEVASYSLIFFGAVALVVTGLFGMGFSVLWRWLFRRFGGV